VKSFLLLRSALEEYCLTPALSLKSAYIEAHSNGINFPLLLVDESKKKNAKFYHPLHDCQLSLVLF
jgi:hypothetical protein